MAEEIVLAPGNTKAKIRNPLGVFGLTLITLGIYSYFYWYYINREMADLGKSQGTTELGENPTTSVIAFSVGALVIVPAVVTYVATARRIQKTQRLRGVEPYNGWLFVLLLIVTLGIAGYPYMQSQLNKAWRSGQLGQASESASLPPSAENVAPVEGATRVHQQP